MPTRNAYRVSLVCAVTAFAWACEKPGAPPKKPSESPAATEAPATASAGREASDSARTDADATPTSPAAGGEGRAVAMDGITMTVPEEWRAQETDGGPMSAKHVFTLPKAEGDAEDGMVRITHFPNMKGMDEANIARWVSQVKRPDGSASTREDAKIEVTEWDHVRLTVVDLSGIVSATMRTTPKPDHRMIAAIVDHPNGPHFVVASGPIKTIAEWEDSILTFLKSAKTG